MSLIGFNFPSMLNDSDGPVEYACFLMLSISHSNNTCLRFKSLLSLRLQQINVLPSALKDKVVSPIAAAADGDKTLPKAGATIAFSPTRSHHNIIMGKGDKDGDYSEAIRKGYKVLPIIFETFGGFSPETHKFFSAVVKVRQDRLTASMAMDAA